MKTLLIFLSLALFPTLSFAQTARVSDDYAVAALRAVVYAQTFNTGSEFSAVKAWELINEADVQARTEAEERSLTVLQTVLVGNWKANHSITQVQNCYAGLKTALKKRDGAVPESCK